MKRAIIWFCAFIIGMSCGCAVTKGKIDDVAGKHDAALVSATMKIKSADTKLASIPNPPAQVAAARGDLKGAVADIGTAQTEAAKLKQIALKQSEKLKDLEDDWIGPRGKQALMGVGVTLALIGLVIVLLRYGKLGGILASMPILGLIVARLGGKKKAS